MFKSLLIVATLAVAAFMAPAVRAQSYNTPIYPDQKGTFNIAATSTNTTCSATNGTVFSATKALNVALMPSYSLISGAGTSATVFTFGESVDGLHWTAGTRTISVTANGTNVVSTSSNFIVGAMGFMRLEGITNPNSTAMTNITITVATKTP